jgi:hypothetical protein
MEQPATLSVSEVALATGFTRQAVYRAIRDGRLNRHLVRDSKGQARLLPEALQAIRSGLLRLRVDSAAGHAPPPSPAPAAAPPAEVWAPWANALLDCGHWGPPPWEPTRWRTLAVVAAEAETLVAQFGEFDAEVWAQLVEEGEA